MAVERVCCDLALFVGLFSILPVYVAASVPVLVIEPFTSTAVCPVDGKDIIKAKVKLDLTGVNKAHYTQSVSINRVPPNEMARGKFDICDGSSSLDLRCISDDGKEHYVFELIQYAERTYSGEWFHAMIYDTTLLGHENSSLVQYPFIKYGPLQTIAVDEDKKNWTSLYEINFKVDNISRTWNVTYDVDGIEWTGNYRVSILDKSMNEIVSSTSSVEINTAIIATIETSTMEFYVSYYASTSLNNTCNHTTKVTITEIPATTSTSTPTPTSSGRSVETTTKGKGGDDDDESGCSTGCVVGIVIGIIIALIVLIVLILLCYRHKKSCISKNCRIDTGICDLEQFVKEHPKLKDVVMKNPTAEFVFFHPDSGEELNRSETLEKLGPNSNLGSWVTVGMQWKLQGSKVAITIKSIKKCDSNPDSMSMQEHTPASENEIPLKPDLQPLPDILYGKEPNNIRKMKKKEKEQSSSQSSFELRNQQTNIDMTDGRHSPGRPFNSIRIHPETLDPSSLNGSGGVDNPGFNISTSHTSHLPITTNFSTDSTSSLGNSGPRKLPPLRNKPPPLEDFNGRPLPSPKSTPI